MAEGALVSVALANTLHAHGTRKDTSEELKHTAGLPLGPLLMTSISRATVALTTAVANEVSGTPATVTGNSSPFPVVESGEKRTRAEVQP
eukprot:1417314-Rhodomonas_salina.1